MYNIVKGGGIIKHLLLSVVVSYRRIKPGKYAKLHKQKPTLN